ncbi:glucose 1-dehydrogenase [Paraflavisolibacter sp. H34]|uniref:SDR family NAD(P)-dependent oxidoreductase n=1 Tax=Huijunlia imazamoxiresistens TaxID=3127457 RepID=UPI00301773CF
MALMENKVVLITGAAQGIGFAAAKAFAEAGASVALADWDEDGVNKATGQLIADGHKALAIVCDVSDEAQVAAMVHKTVEAFGKLDAAFNNAGIQNVLADAADQTKEDFDRVTGVNLRGVWSCMKYELQQMRRQGSGAIVNCSSIGGILGGAQRGTYHAAKHGVIGLTKSAALEYAPLGIRINTICPGIIHTPMVDKMMAGGQQDALDAMMKTVPVKRLGRPEEIARAVLWLCSEGASFVVGHTLVVDGGYSIQ